MYKVRNISITLNGAWQSLGIEGFFVGIQLRNDADNDAVEYRWANDDAALEIAPGEVYEVVSPSPEKHPIENTLQVKGAAGQKLIGERWLYEYQA